MQCIGSALRQVQELYIYPPPFLYFVCTYEGFIYIYERERERERQKIMMNCPNGLRKTYNNMTQKDVSIINNGLETCADTYIPKGKLLSGQLQ